MADPFGGVLTSIFDDADRLTSRKFGGASQTPLRIDPAYNDRNEMTTLTRYSDLAGSTVVGTSIYTRDDAGRLTALDHKNGSNTVLASYVYTYDNADKLTSETVNGGLRTFSYDRTDQLTNDGGTNYTYDANGNRTMVGYQTGTANRMTNDGTYTYTYDDAGNTIKKSKGANDETWTYAFDHNNHLTGIEKRATDGGTLQLKVTYTYDAVGSRVQEEKWKTGVGTSTERYAYDNGHVWADLDGSNALLMRRFFGDGVDDLLARISSGGTLAFYLKDTKGSVNGVVNSSGTVIGTMAYDAWGKVTSSSGSLDRYGYTGRERDDDTGWQYHRERFYDVNTGRWVNPDPIGFSAGDPNLYRYVGNNPTNLTDPSGLAPPTPFNPLGPPPGTPPTPPFVFPVDPWPYRHPPYPPGLPTGGCGWTTVPYTYNPPYAGAPNLYFPDKFMKNWPKPLGQPPIPGSVAVSDPTKTVINIGKGTVVAAGGAVGLDMMMHPENYSGKGGWNNDVPDPFRDIYYNSTSKYPLRCPGIFSSPDSPFLDMNPFSYLFGGQTPTGQDDPRNPGFFHYLWGSGDIGPFTERRK